MNKLEKGHKLFVNKKLNTSGYGFGGEVIYNIKDGHIPFLSLKEWDFYQITNKRFSIYAIIGHVSYATSLNITLFDFETKKNYYIGKLTPFKKVKMDNNANEDSYVSYKSKKYSISIQRVGKERFIKMEAIDKIYGKCSVDIKLSKTLDDSVLVLLPFDKKNQFYLDQKECLLKASGYVNIGDIKYELDDDSFGLLDWARGVLPFKHEWVWGVGSGIVDGKPFGFNIGSFANTKEATENIFFYDGKTYKMNYVDIDFDKNDYFRKWTYKSDDGSFVFEMVPFYDNFTKTKVLWVDNSCHQMFGHFNGYIIVDGKKIEIKDFLAFTENAHNRW